ncbi:MAG: LpxD N-terminal domain-containing protein [Vulcanimicrobiota bacterium]
MSATLAELAALVGGTVSGPEHLAIERVAGVEQADASTLTFAEDAQSLERACQSPAAAVLCQSAPADKPAIVVAKPRVAFAKALAFFHPHRPHPPGRHPTSFVHAEAQVDDSCWIGPWCVVEAGAVLEARVELVARVAVGAGARLGPGCRLNPGVSLGAGAQLGPECLLEAGSHVGEGASLGARVDVGGRSRVMAGAQVGEGTKIDNLVTVEAGVKTGKHCIFVSKSLVGPGARLGDYVITAGQSMVAARAELGSMIQVGGRAIASGRLEAAGPYLGQPAIPLKQEMRRRALEARQERNLLARREKPAPPE